MEVVRFGVGRRRPEGPPGTVGLTGVAIHGDGRGSIAELAFGRNARIAPHSNPNTTWLVVIEGGGWVAVGDERSRVSAGEAVLWPANVVHAAWTEHSEMRAIVVEMAGADDAVVRGLIAATGRPALEAGVATPASPGSGGLQAPDRPTDATAREGEPY